MRLLLLYLVLAGVWAWRLRPMDQPEMDAQRIPRLEKLTRYLTKAPPSVVKPILFSIVGLSDEHLALVDGWLSRHPLDQLRELTVQDSPMLKDTGSLRKSLLLAWLGQAELGAIDPSYAMIAASGKRFDDQILMYAYQTLAARAEKNGDASIALPILLRVAELPNAKWQNLTTYISAAQGQGQDAQALHVLKAWLTKFSTTKDTNHLMDARELEMALLHRLKRADDSFFQQIEYLRQAPAIGPLPGPDLDRAITSGRTCGQQIQLVPWLERQLATYPEHQTKPSELLKKATIDTNYIHWLNAYASIIDHHSETAGTENAFDACLRLAATGERCALTRLCALAESAKRLPDAEALLKEGLAQPALQSCILELSQSSALALRVVTEALRTAPKDRHLHFAAALAEAKAKPSSATSHWQAYLRKFPSDLPAQRRLIKAHLLAKQPDLALKVYRSIETKDLTLEDENLRNVLSQL